MAKVRLFSSKSPGISELRTPRMQPAVRPYVPLDPALVVVAEEVLAYDADPAEVEQRRHYAGAVYVLQDLQRLLRSAGLVVQLHFRRLP